MSGDDHDHLSNSENEQRADTWFLKIRVIVCLNTGRNFSDVLNARKEKLESNFATAWFHGLHALHLIWKIREHSTGNFKAICTTILQTKRYWACWNACSWRILCEEIHPGRCNEYTKHPFINKYLKETMLAPLACSAVKRLGLDFRGSSSQEIEIKKCRRHV